MPYVKSSSEYEILIMIQNTLFPYCIKMSLLATRSIDVTSFMIFHLSRHLFAGNLIESLRWQKNQLFSDSI